ncbi:PREDICTED: uncharacterized protein LOC108562982 [Nicrophorus vespilloides]|uniref:Uncharacterized protein LOC108562982 n=1 Tax=Nicrophorus vespilloides TaxID=110193 RepID=A0ABM1MQY8_NICVS|nr:PREDICTED: uncharacterized protein LOC108562982 [Nicrophorus vespilloides]
MQLQTILVLVALAAFDSASAYPQNAEEVRSSIGKFQDATSSALATGSQKLKTLIAEIEAASASAEDKSLKKLDELKTSTNTQIVKLEQTGKNDCVKIAKADLTTSLDGLKKLIKNCGSNAKSKSNQLLDEVQNTLGGDAYRVRAGYFNQLDACIKKNSESCLNDLLAVVKENTKVYPEELLKRFDPIALSLSQIKSDVDKCLSNTDNEATNASNKIITQLNECIKSK